MRITPWTIGICCVVLSGSFIRRVSCNGVSNAAKSSKSSKKSKAAEECSLKGPPLSGKCDDCCECPDNVRIIFISYVAFPGCLLSADVRCMLD
mmetsp:Transcript_468/g.1037  ORF Transcript_468/g.1037 Transcript_468/m.1037 type:complete len:93 (+) Transcript_468:71-349(+)